MPGLRSVLVGTTKGAFVLDAKPDRSDFEVRGPFCDGWPINHVASDPETGRMWAAGGGDWFGAGVFRSDDGGKTWTLSKLTSGDMDEWAANDPEFAKMIGWTDTPAPFEKQFSQVWSLHFAHGVLYAGTKPAMLLASRDGGVTWDIVNGLTDHPSRPDWHGGAAGLVLHTIVPDPADADRMWVAISAAGVFATEDGGKTWDRRNRLSNTDHVHHAHPAAPKGGETGHCVHNMVRAPGDGIDVLYQQNHHGVFRSPDGGRSWDDVTEGLPSTFGFPIAVHPRDPDRIWTLPLNGDTEGRYPPDASAAVWRSSDSGAHWEKCQSGLPDKNCFFTVLRQSMSVDLAEPVGVYFGTNTGSIFASRDEGDTWSEVARHLPTVLCVETMADA
ncbi:WD40/YVTN/BNR-like repeat-containing protein [Flavimaricola marinus]|uniref:BNR/Asp-box repeat protein n=1 Tax=Flavimaricola marinus TaxID=1819565 RepID=A0A238LHG3_9RHOB|nr:sialidase family protein [Flavimaricola marinus]SMY09022.1 BNR/Asp-box repeat protein [Flavimaricola marinus]